METEGMREKIARLVREGETLPADEVADRILALVASDRDEIIRAWQHESLKLRELVTSGGLGVWHKWPDEKPREEGHYIVQTTNTVKRGGKGNGVFWYDGKPRSETPHHARAWDHVIAWTTFPSFNPAALAARPAEDGLRDDLMTWFRRSSWQGTITEGVILSDRIYAVLGRGKP
jgi:hypothetical protein